MSGLADFETTMAPKLQTLAKTLARLGRLKVLEQQASQLNLVDMRKLLQDVRQSSQDSGNQATELEELLRDYQLVAQETDQEEWMRVFVAECHALGHAVDGEYPTLRVFPVEVKVDVTHDLVQVNNRIVRVLHPKAVAALVSKEVAKRYKERFNVNQFLRALVRIYDVLMAERISTTLEQGQKNIARSVPLKQIYSLLSVRTGATGYSQNQFAFDLYRVRTESDLMFEGRRLVFESTRNASGAIVIPLPGGQKENIGSLEVVGVQDERDE